MKHDFISLKKLIGLWPKRSAVNSEELKQAEPVARRARLKSATGGSLLQAMGENTADTPVGAAVRAEIERRKIVMVKLIAVAAALAVALSLVSLNQAYKTDDRLDRLVQQARKVKKAPGYIPNPDWQQRTRNHNQRLKRQRRAP